MSVLFGRRPADRRQARALAAGVVICATAVLGCSPAPTASPATGLDATASPGVVAPTTAPSTGSAPPVSTPSPAPESFAWAARPSAFVGEEGGSFVNVAAGPNGFVALSVRDPGTGIIANRLWGSADGLAWEPIATSGLPDPAVIGGVWGAAGVYWLTASIAESDDPGQLYRSTDGRTWSSSHAFSGGVLGYSVSDGCPPSTAAPSAACPVFVTGTKGVDGAIWRSTDGGDSWAAATVADAIGWQGEQDAAVIEIFGVVATSSGLIAFGNGLPNSPDLGGDFHSRFWRSTDDGITWSRVPSVPEFAELYVRDVVATDGVVVAIGGDVGEHLAVALTSSDGGVTWSQATTPGLEAEGALSRAFAGPEGFLGLGFANPARVDDFPLRAFAWTSADGSSWHTIAPGDLEGGIVDDAARLGDRIVAVGRGWTTDVTGTWEAPVGPAVWTLKL